MTAFATAADLASYLQQTFTTEQTATANLLLDLASNEIRSVSGQQVDVTADDVVDIEGTADVELVLPQRPAQQPTAVLVGGVAVTDWTFDRDVLRRRSGWLAFDTVTGFPLRVRVTYTHGWATPPAELRRVALQAAARAMRNPSGLQSWTTGSEQERFHVRTDGLLQEVDLTPDEVTAVRRALGVPRRRTNWLNPSPVTSRLPGWDRLW